MTKGQFFESLIGVIVIAAAVLFLAYAYRESGRALTSRTYSVDAVFGRIDGVSVGSEVRISGMKVGAVSQSALDPKTYEARVKLALARDVAVPEDSVAKIVSDGLLGGARVSIEPGGSDVMLADGETIAFTQGSVDLLGLAVQAFTKPAKGDAPPSSSEPSQQDFSQQVPPGELE